MWSKNKKPMTTSEREWVGMVKEGPCSCCEAEVPCEAHEIEQGLWFTSVAWCPDCHRGVHGWHQTKSYFKIRKLDEIKCLNITVENVFARIRK